MEYYTRYKDRLPEDSLRIAKNILKQFNITCVEEVSCCNPISNVFSNRIYLPEFDFGVNGKGVTKEYCLASSYGELLEKLLNCYFPRNMYRMTPYKTYNSFYDGKEFIISNEILNLPDDILNDLKNSFNDSDGRYPSDKELVDVYQHFFGCDATTSIPFYDVKNNNVVYLPEKILSSLSRSNGMSCGNTLEEAVSQALCEIFERYAFQKIIIDKLTPPEIPLLYIRNSFPQFNKILDEFNKTYELTFYDCSLGVGLPVVCLLLLDKRTNDYKINFGSHISLCIAIERCLTEILQGFDSLDSLKQGMFNIKSNIYKSIDINDLYFRFIRNIGMVPYEFFFETSSWKFSPWGEYSYASNVEIVNELLKLCLKISSNVYIRNNTCMDMSAVRVYVPELSPIRFVSSLGCKNKYSVEEKYILEGLNYDNIHIENLDSYERVIKLNSYRISQSTNIDSSVLLACISYDKGNIIEAINYLKNVDSIPKYVEVLLQFLNMNELGYSIENIGHILNKFYSKNDISFVITLLNSKSLFESVLRYRTYDVHDKDYYIEVENNTFTFFKKYCEYMKNNPINQFDTTKIIKF